MSPHFIDRFSPQEKDHGEDRLALRGEKREKGAPKPGGILTFQNPALGGFLAIALFFLLTEHRAHFLGALPWLLLLACPLLHMIHGGHAGRGALPQPATDSARDEEVECLTEGRSSCKSESSARPKETQEERIRITKGEQS
jgi:hypothetical protein